MDEKTTDEKPGNGDANGGGSEQAQTETTFSQDQVDQIVSDRLKRAAVTNTNELLEKLGADSVDAATKAIKDANKLREEQMSELEKAQAATATAVAQNEAMAKSMEFVKAEAAETMLQSAVLVAAVDLNDPKDAWLHIDRSAIEVQPDGSYKGLAEAIKTLVKDKPYLVKQDTQSPLTPGSKKIANRWNGQSGGEKKEIDGKEFTKDFSF